MGIDPATQKTGVAVVDGDRLLSHYLIDHSNVKDVMRRIPMMAESIAKAVETGKPDRVFVEYTREVKHGNVDVTIKLSWLVGIIWEVCLARDIPIILLLPGEWRAAIGLTGGRNTKRDEFKERALEYVKAKYGTEFQVDVAEAVCIAEAGSIMAKGTDRC